MSDARSIAAVTAALVDSLARPGPAAAVPGALVTHFPPGSLDLEGAPCINVWLAAVVSPRPDHLILRKGEGPGRAPGLSLNLLYRLTFHGDHAAFEPHRLMGHAATALAAQPVLSLAAIAATIERTPVLKGCDLARTGQPLRITMVGREADAALADPEPALLYEVGPLALG